MSKHVFRGNPGGKCFEWIGSAAHSIACDMPADHSCHVEPPAQPAAFIGGGVINLSDAVNAPEATCAKPGCGWVEVAHEPGGMGTNGAALSHAFVPTPSPAFADGDVRADVHRVLSSQGYHCGATYHLPMCDVAVYVFAAGRAAERREFLEVLAIGDPNCRACCMCGDYVHDAIAARGKS